MEDHSGDESVAAEPSAERLAKVETAATSSVTSKSGFWKLVRR